MMWNTSGVKFLKETQSHLLISTIHFSDFGVIEYTPTSQNSVFF